MSTFLLRRNSMTLLSLYDLESFVNQSISIKNEQLPKLTINDQCKIQVETSFQKSIFENLPNEVLIYMFQFLSAYDLYKSFYKLNFRLNTICHTQKLNLDLTLIYRISDYFSSDLYLFASQIYSIELTDKYNRLTLVNRYINIDCFTNLRLLTIEYASSINFDKILSKLHLFPFLSYLNIYSILIQYSNQISSILKIKSLKYLILHSYDPIILHFDDNNINPFIQLEYLSLNSCSLIDFFQLLKYIGLLIKKISINLLYQNEDNLSSTYSLIINQLISNNNIPQSLRYLQISFNFLSLNHFQLILRLFPHLIHLTFSTLTNDLDFISATIWHSFISIHLLKLKKLQFYIKITDLSIDQIQQSLTELIDSFYELNQNWLIGPVIIDYNQILTSKLLEFYTYSQPISNRKYSTEFYGKERYISKTMIDSNININKNITELKITLTDDQQTTVITDQLLINRQNDIYPDIKTITILSQMTIISIENDRKSNLICSDLMKFIPDLSKITTINFRNDLSMNATNPSVTLARRLLNKMSKIETLELSYDYLYHLLQSPLIVRILTKNITSLYIRFSNHRLVPDDINQIAKVFATNLHWLDLEISHIEYLPDDIRLILSLLFSDKWKNLYKFTFNLLKDQLEKFSDLFKQIINDYLHYESEKQRLNFKIIEYEIFDNEFSISF